MSKKYFFIFNFWFLFLILLAPPQSSWAISTQGVSLTPVLSEITADPGEVIERSLRITNQSSKQTTFFIETHNYLVEEDKEEFLPPEEGDEIFNLARWIKMDKKEVSLLPGETFNLAFSITVPDNAQSGSHQAIIFVSTTPPLANLKESSSITVGSQVGALVFLTVSGEIKEQAIIVAFFSQKKLIEKPPLEFSLRFHNNGNVYLTPKGEITILDKQGKTVQRLAINADKGKTLATQTRQYTAVWSSTNQRLIGKYQAQLVLAFGNPQQTLTALVYFWILPIKLILGIFLSLVGFIPLTVLAIKRYNRWIIKQALAKLPRNPKSTQKKKKS